MYNIVNIRKSREKYMWKELPDDQKKEYKRMILAFSSLTEMFAQKNETSDDDEDDNQTIMLSPIINSKYQETVFQKVFEASAEDIGNTSYDVAFKGENIKGETIKYLIGIKTFGINSGNQKVAQFKANHNDWAEIINEINNNSLDDNGNRLSKAEIDKINKHLYLQLAKSIANLRNERIDSSKANLRGFHISVKSDTIETIYHVLMPSSKGDTPYILAL